MYRCLIALACALAACSETPDARTSNETSRFIRVPVELQQPAPLNLQRVFSVASDSLTTLVPTRPLIVRRQDGTYVVASSGNESLVVHLDSAGQFLRIIGGVGDGPGEYRSVSDLALLSGDTLVVSGAQRLSLFAPDGEFVKRVQSQSVVVLRGVRSVENGRLIVGGFPRADIGNEQPLHVLDANGKHVSSLGEPSPAGELYSARELPRVMNTSADGPLIYAEESYYVLRFVGANGNDSVAYSFDSDKLLGSGASNSEDATVSIPNKQLALRAQSLNIPRVWRRMQSIAADSNSAVWVAVIREKAGWENVTRTYRWTLPGNQGERMESDDADDLLYETVVHVWSLQPTAKLLGELVVPFSASLAGPGVLVHSSYEPSGETRVEAYRLTLQ